MKTLLLVRHAKSSWEEPGMSDFDRPLNERGKKDAPQMAKRVQEKGIDVDLFVSSPAKRALRTARFFAEEWKQDKEDILVIEPLYLAGFTNFQQAVSGLPNGKNVAALFSHNPGITGFANSLTNVKIDDMPTCSVYAVSAAVDSWEEFIAAEKKFLFFDYPKNPLS
jgi:phosphohistidine phosphatase